MQTLNITNEKQRDGEVIMESPPKTVSFKKVTMDGGELISAKFLKQNINLAFETLLTQHKNLRELGQAIIDGDPEVDIELTGKRLEGTRKLYLRQNDKIAYRIDMQVVIRDPQGIEKERKDLTKAMSNISGEDVVRWSGKKFDKAETIRKYVFTRKMQLKHISGLTYDFLFGMAKELHETNSLMFMGGGKKGNEPLVITQGGEPYRGFLEGRLNGERYILILHLTNMEMKAV
jgi:hypothetical protein